VTESWKREVTIEIGVAVAWKVFAARQDASVVKSLGEGKRVLDHVVWRSAERAVTDYWVVRVCVDIEHRREIQVDSYRAQLLPENHCGVPGQTRVASCCQGTHRREPKHGFAETSHATAFLIDTDQDWIRRVGFFDARGDQFRGLIQVIDVPLEQDQTRYGVFRQPAENRGRSFGAAKTADDHIAGHSFELVHFVGRP
jgi:hypothetical protein